MTRRLLKKFLVGLIGGVAIALSISIFYTATASTSFYYAITDLGNLDPSKVPNSSSAYDINNSGLVVGNSGVSVTQIGSSSPTGYYHAFKWKNDTMIDLEPFRRRSSQANGTNNFGLVVGSFSINRAVLGTAGSQNQYTRAVLWRNNTMINLGTLGGSDSQAYDINDPGQIVGSSSTTSGATHAFKWEKGTMTDLGTRTSGYGSSYAYDINNKGQIVGYSEIQGGPYQAVKWENGQIIELGALADTYSHSKARAINNKGQVVGESQYTTKPSGPYHAFLWHNNTMTDLGSLGGDMSFATDINEAGVVVGYSNTVPKGGHRGFVWRKGHMTDLNQLLPPNSGWRIENAYGINDRGQIVGKGVFNNSNRAFLLTPVWVTN